jgi:hypothetical protein
LPLKGSCVGDLVLRLVVGPLRGGA